MFLGFLGFRFSELFSNKSIPHGSSGQTAMWKRIPYGSSPFQVFVKKSRKYWFLKIRFRFFMITLFSPFVRLKPVQAGFCVSTQTPGGCWIFDTDCTILFSFFLSFSLAFFLSWGNPLAAAGGTGVGTEHCPSFKDIE